MERLPIVFSTIENRIEKELLELHNMKKFSRAICILEMKSWMISYYSARIPERVGSVLFLSILERNLLKKIVVICAIIANEEKRNPKKFPSYTTK